MTVPRRYALSGSTAISTDRPAAGDAGRIAGSTPDPGDDAGGEPPEPEGADAPSDMDPRDSASEPLISPERPSPERIDALAIHLAWDESLPQDPATVASTEESLRGALARAGRELGFVAGELSVMIVGDETMDQLHTQYKDVPGTTDVLTFDLRSEEDPGDRLDAELVLCLDEAKRQADRRGHQVLPELVLYGVHGLLHLVGEDDQDPVDAARMHTKEDEILRKLGFGAIYDRPETSDPESASPGGAM